MTLVEIRNLRATCRAKIEDLLGRTSSREMSTEENQMFTDLKAEGERLASLESRYAVLESFDKPAAPIVRPPLITPQAKENQSREEWIDKASGKSIRVLAPTDRMVDLVQLTAAHSELSLGKCLRGVVTGKWEGAEARAFGHDRRQPRSRWLFAAFSAIQPSD